MLLAGACGGAGIGEGEASRHFGGFTNRPNHSIVLCAGSVKCAHVVVCLIVRTPYRNSFTRNGICLRRGRARCSPRRDEVESVMAIQKKMLVGNLVVMLAFGGMLTTAPVVARAEYQRIRAVAHARTAPRAEPARPVAPEPTWTAPTWGRITSAFGSRWGMKHRGVDIANAIGTPVSAAASGTVVDSGPASGYGLWIRVRHDDDVVSVYGHIHESLVVVGQRVDRGMRIATLGNRGRSSGPHLHFQLEVSGRPVDPAAFYRTRAAVLTG